MDKVRVFVAGRSNGADLGMDDEILRYGGVGFGCSGSNGGAVVREMVDGGAYSIQMA